jgi:hypothetical protein
MSSKDSTARKVSQMVTVPSHPKKSAEDELLEAVGQMIDEAAEKMPHEEFMRVSKKVKDDLDRAIDVHSRRRGTA